MADPFAQFGGQSDTAAPKEKPSDVFAQFGGTSDVDPDTFEAGGTFEAALIGGAQTLTLGTSDEIIAFTRSLTSGDTYEKALKEEREKIAFAKEKSPAALAIGGAAGALVGALSPAGAIGAAGKLGAKELLKTASKEGIAKAGTMFLKDKAKRAALAVGQGALTGLGVSERKTLEDAVVAAVSGGKIAVDIIVPGSIASAFIGSKTAKLALASKVGSVMIKKLFRKYDKTMVKAAKKSFKVKKGGKTERLKREKILADRAARQKERTSKRAARKEKEKMADERRKAEETQRMLERQAEQMTK